MNIMPVNSTEHSMAKTEQKHAVGRPPKYQTPQKMQDKIDEYFESCWFEQVKESTDAETGKTDMTVIRYQQRPYTISGLAYHLEMTTEALRNYQDKDEFLVIVKRAKQKVEMNFEENLAGKNPTGSIFWLKNHAGYRDKTEQELSGANGGPVQIQNVKEMTDDQILALIAANTK